MEHSHRELMRLRANPNTRTLDPQCDGVCLATYSQGSWTCYRCQRCQAVVSAYEGEAHVWNYILSRRVETR